MNFEWDEAKAALNLVRRGISFEEAVTVFDDPLYVDFYDPKHSQAELAILSLESLTEVGCLSCLTQNGKKLLDQSALENLRLLSGRIMKKAKTEIDDLLSEYDLKSLHVRRLGPGRRSFGSVRLDESGLLRSATDVQMPSTTTTHSPVVFIGHSSSDKGFVRRLVNKLNGDGIETWFDEFEIRVGDSIHQRTNEGLKKSDFFIIVLSQASVRSPWVQEELGAASHIEKYEQRGVFILPLLLEECDVPPLLLDRRYANLKDDPESAYQELLDALYHHSRKSYPESNLNKLHDLKLTTESVPNLLKDPSLLSNLPPRHFEELVAKLLTLKGFRTTLTSATRDGGFDIIAESDSLLGLSPQRFLVQCKRVARPIGADDIRQLLGTLIVLGVDRVVFATSSYFTKAAQELATGNPIDLVDAKNIAEWIKEQGESGSDDSLP